MNTEPKPLSTKQKAAICSMAARAYKVAGIGMGYSDVSDFRHACVYDVTGKTSLLFCDQADYIPLYNYLGAMIGVPAREDKTPKNALERAMWVLRDALKRFEFSDNYAAAIASDRLRMSFLIDLDAAAELLGAEGIRQVTYTVINRGRAAARKVAATYSIAEGVEYHTAATLPPDGLAEHFSARRRV